MKRETRVPRRERSESHVCPLALYHFLSSERLCIHCSRLAGINFHISIERMMHFDLLKYFLKVCGAGTALGICYPTVTKTRVIPAPSLGISCLAQLSLLPRQKIYPNHDGPNCVVALLPTALELLECCGRGLARHGKGLFGMSSHFGSSSVEDCLTRFYVLKRP